MIGVFDSGSGGLTVLRAIRKRLPSSDFVYFGDIANAPYGSKTQEELSRLTARSMRLLKDRGATSIVSACNSVSASLAVSLFDAFGIDPANLIEMVGPTVSAFKDSPARILLVATPATVRSGIYQNAFAMIGKEVKALPIPELAGAIEFGAPEEEQERAIRGALAGVDVGAYDAVVLACTHYPLAYDLFRRIIPERVLVIDPAYAVAERVERQFWPREAGEGKLQLIVSKESAPFRSLIGRFFPGHADAIEVLE